MLIFNFVGASTEAKDCQYEKEENRENRCEKGGQIEQEFRL